MGMSASAINKRILRKTYENIAGSISDRQWRRIRHELGLKVDDVSDEALLDVKAYASLRRIFPKSSIDPTQIGRYRNFMDSFPLSGCNGRDLLNAIQKTLKPSPEERTVRDWGYAIGCPLYYEKWYSKQELELWVGKMLCLRRYKILWKLPGKRVVMVEEIDHAA